jgi:hypothetical protein
MWDANQIKFCVMLKDVPILISSVNLMVLWGTKYIKNFVMFEHFSFHVEKEFSEEIGLLKGDVQEVVFCSVWVVLHVP